MAGRTSQVITAADDTDEGDPGTSTSQSTASAHDIPEGLVSNRSSDVRPNQNTPNLDDFDIIDVDNPGQRQDTRGSDAPLTGGAQDTYLDQQQQDEPLTPKQNRRLSQKEGKQRNIERNRALEAENAELREQMNRLAETVGRIEPRLGEIDTQHVQRQISDIDRQIGDMQRLFESAEDQISAAVINADPEALKKAMRDRDQAVMTGNRLTVEKNMLETGSPTGQRLERQQGAPERQQQQPPPPMRAAVVRNVQSFNEQHDWMDPQSRDTQVRDDSRLMLMLDNQVAADGFDPASQDYWDELEDRAARYMPHRFQESRQAAEPEPRAAREQPAPRQQEQVRRGPMTSGAGDRAPPRQGARQQVQLTSERKRAMIEVGALDNDGRTIVNREKYSRLIKSYADFDAQHGGVRQ